MRARRALLYTPGDDRHKIEKAATLGVDRFLREIEVAANLQHPHILPVLDSGEAGGVLYYVVPHVGGEALRGPAAAAARSSFSPCSSVPVRNMTSRPWSRMKRASASCAPSRSSRCNRSR